MASASSPNHGFCSAGLLAASATVAEESPKQLGGRCFLFLLIWMWMGSSQVLLCLFCLLILGGLLTSSPQYGVVALASWRILLRYDIEHELLEPLGGANGCNPDVWG
jgi:hypothetical protein